MRNPPPSSTASLFKPLDTTHPYTGRGVRIAPSLSIYGTVIGVVRSHAIVRSHPEGQPCGERGALWRLLLSDLSVPLDDRNGPLSYRMNPHRV